MKQLILTFFLLFLSKSFSQNLVDYKINKDVSIKMPENFQILDTLQQSIVKGFIGNDIVMIVKPVQKDTIVKIENEKDLLKYYEGVQEGILNNDKGKLLVKEIVKIKGLDLLKLSCSMLINGERKIWDSFTLFLNNYVYSFVFIHATSKNENFTIQKEKIISSLKFRNGLTIHNQFNDYEDNSTAAAMGQLTGTILFYLVVIGGSIFLIFRRKNK